MPIGKLGRRRHVVIPQDICDKVGLKEGDFVEVQAVRGRVIIKPKKLVDADGLLPFDEERRVSEGIGESC
jgi:AbrB family looped-hinge helix DNA binding protein